MYQFTVGRRDLAWAVALIVLLSAVWTARGDIVAAGPPPPPPGQGIARVYVTVATNFPDALGVGPGAGANAAPIIILPTNPPIPAASAAELVRLDPREVVIVGGTGVISAAMETALGSLLPNASISRISGADRYVTNAAFSQQTFPIEGWISLPASAFTADHTDVDVALIDFVAYNVTDSFVYAPVQLPHGAEILELKAEMYDGTPAVAGVTLGREAGDTSTVNIAGLLTSGSPGFTTLSTTVIASAYAIVDNEHYSYFVQAVGVDGDPYMVHVMIRYRLGASS